MEEALKALLLNLATDPRKLSEYLKERESYVGLTTLSAEARDAVLAGDQERVARLVGAAVAGHTTIVMGKQYHKKKKKKGSTHPVRKPK
jgi:hypothetical protein